MKRREFLAAVISAVVATSADLPLAENQKKLIARYRCAYDIQRDEWLHRFDVRADGNAYYVEGSAADRVLSRDDVETMIEFLNQLLGEEVKVAL